MLEEREGTVLSEQMRKWDLTRTLANPPNVARIPRKLVHIRQYAMDMAYVPPYAVADTRKTFKKRVCDVLMRVDEVKHSTPELRIVRKYPGISWERIWKNLHASMVTDMVKSAWFAAMHDIVPTNNRLAAIRLMVIMVRRTGLYSTQNYRMCGRTAHLGLDAGKTGDDTSYEPQTHTT
jgi:hypothetical protein